LPLEAEDEIRGLDEARRRVADLERQIKSVNGGSGAQRIDQTTVERAATAAAERERIAWQRKMEQGRARFRRNWVTKYISPGDPAIARMDSEERIHGENGVDDVSAGTADAPGVGALAA